MSNTERLALLAAGAVALAVLWLVAATVLFRLCVAVLWGSGSGYGVIAAPVVLSLGVVGLACLAVGMVRVVRKAFNKIGDTE